MMNRLIISRQHE